MAKINITPDLIKHVGNLARLELTGDELGTIQHDLQKMLDYFRNLEEVETKGVQPMVSPVSRHFLKGQTSLKQRDGEVETSLEGVDVLRNTVARRDGQFKINSVIVDE